jgi:nucleoside-diphosphate-sugar epimerase
VGDVVEANKSAALADLRPGSVFNIGGGSPVSMSETISMLEKIIDTRIEIVLNPLGPGNPMVTTADCTAASSILDWKPTTDIYTGLKAQVDWQLGQK